MTIEVMLDEAKKTVTKHQLFILAARGMIVPETIIYVDGKPVQARKVKNILFGKPKNAEKSSNLVPQPVSVNPSDAFNVALNSILPSLPVVTTSDVTPASLSPPSPPTPNKRTFDTPENSTIELTVYTKDSSLSCLLLFPALALNIVGAVWVTMAIANIVFPLIHPDWGVNEHSDMLSRWMFSITTPLYGIIMVAVGIILRFILLDALETQCPSCRQFWAVEAKSIRLLYGRHVLLNPRFNTRRNPCVLTLIPVKQKFKCKHCGYEWIYKMP